MEEYHSDDILKEILKQKASRAAKGKPQNHGQQNRKSKVYKSFFDPKSDNSGSSSESSNCDSSSESSEDIGSSTKTETNHHVTTSGKKQCPVIQQKMDKADGTHKDSENVKELNRYKLELMSTADAETVPDSQESQDSEQELYETIEKKALSNFVSALGQVLGTGEELASPAQPYMGPYGKIRSPFKKRSSFKGFPQGIKRSPLKAYAPRTKRTKLFADDDVDERVRKIDLLADPNDSSEDSSIDEINNIPIPSSFSTITASDSQAKTKAEEPSSSKSTQSAGVAADDHSDDEDGQWHIVESDGEGNIIDEQIDAALEEKSSKFCLSAINVKSIIHKIITNDSVVEMVRKAVQEQINENEARYEPKMTRAKLKQFEKEGQVPASWALSPVKQSKKEEGDRNFLDLDLPEDEDDDEDFDPSKVVQESDEDSESVISSCLSDLGSPAPSTPRSEPSTPGPYTEPTTPGLNTTLVKGDTPSTGEQNGQQCLLSPMGPPLVKSVPRSGHKSGGLGRKFQDRMDKHEEEEELICNRTRSKHPLTEHSILEFEANFIAPDILPDMYDISTDYDDHHWMEFLTQFSQLQPESCSQLPETDGDEDDPNDPEFNFLQEVEMFEIDQEDFRDDRAVKVSKKEVTLLFDELQESINNYDPLDEICKETIKTQSEKIVLNSSKRKQYQQKMIQEIGDHERKQIKDQLRKHVQQLTQTYVLAQDNVEEHKTTADTAVMYLRELKSFADKMEAQGHKDTFYRTCNLDGAITVLDTYHTRPIPHHYESDVNSLEGVIFKYYGQILPPLSFRQMYVMWSDATFMYPQLLPYGGLFKLGEEKKDRSRVKFLPSEDNLLSMGLQQFSHLSNSRAYIQQFMLPCKTLKQIQIRIKNLVANNAKDNAVKFWKKFKSLPKFEQIVPEFDLSHMKAVKDKDLQLTDLPFWCKFFSRKGQVELMESAHDLKERQREWKRKNKSCHSVSYTSQDMCTLGLSGKEHETISAPVMPSLYSPSCESTSSGSSLDEVPIRRKCLKLKRQARKRHLERKQKNSMSLLSSFLPLSLTNNLAPRVSPVTVCMVNESTVNRPGSQQTSPLNSGTGPMAAGGTSQISPVLIASPAGINDTSPSSQLSVVSQPSVIMGQQLTLASTGFGSLGTTGHSLNVVNECSPLNVQGSTLNSGVPSSGTPLLNPILTPVKTVSSSSPPLTFTQPMIAIRPKIPVVVSQPSSSLAQYITGPPILPRPSPAPQQTIIVINHTAPVHMQNFNTNQTAQSPIILSQVGGNLSAFNSPMNNVQVAPATSCNPGISTIQNAVVSEQIFATNSVPLVSLPAPSSVIEPDSDTTGFGDHMPTFEELCRPIMEAEMGAVSSVAHDSFTNQNSPSVISLATAQKLLGCGSPVKSDFQPQKLINSSLPFSSLVPTVKTSFSNLNTRTSIIAMPLRYDGNENKNQSNSGEQSAPNANNYLPSSSQLANNGVPIVQIQPVEIQSEIISSTTPEKLADDIPASTLAGSVLANVGEHPREITPTQTIQRAVTPINQCGCTHTQELSQENSGSNHSRQSTQSSSPSSASKTHRSAIDILATFAPVFMTPTKSSNDFPTDEETTPTQRPGGQYVKLLPKPTPPSGEKVDPAMFRKCRSSPRRKQLKQQAKAILPKGFVISSSGTSPAKKVASTLVDKAKQVKGYCNILPKPTGYSPLLSPTKQSKRPKAKSARKNLQADKSFQFLRKLSPKPQKLSTATSLDSSHSSAVQLSADDDHTGNNDCEGADRLVDVESEDRLDTESDEFTQSEDDGDTQGTDDGEDAMDTQEGSDGFESQGTDSQDESQEEDDEGHMADLMAASTTLRFAPVREDDLARSRLGKKDRDRDLLLAMLAPDIVEADPQRDMRDTMFVQSYLQRVKKVLRGDLDTLEKFLRLMDSFTKTEKPTIQLYRELATVFTPYPDLLYDFAGFLQPDQALQCGCYKACMEFQQARTFLRKLEIFFSKNPSQYQKCMRVLSRWHKKSARDQSDLRDQVEPMLKGQKHLLEEFSRFFPNDKPPESPTDDFEEINLESGSSDNNNNSPRSGGSNFEEINLMELEEVYGTKRCGCTCHDSGDDTMKKRKKHCYNCCLTVIDGELAYKVNKNTIKRVNVTFGPPVKLSDLVPESDQKIEPLSHEIGNQTTIEQTGSPPVVLDNEIKMELSDGQSTESKEPAIELETPTEMEVECELTGEVRASDSLLDKEKASSELDRASVQSIEAGSVSVKLSKSSTEENNVTHPENEAMKSLERSTVTSPALNQSLIDEPCSSAKNEKKQLVQAPEELTVTIEDKPTETMVEESAVKPQETEVAQVLSMPMIDTQATESDINVSESGPSMPTSGKDLLASAFTHALSTEVSMDSVGIFGPSTSKEFHHAAMSPFKQRHHSGKSSLNVSSVMSFLKSSVEGHSVNIDAASTTKPSALSARTEESAATQHTAPKGDAFLHVSSDSSFSKLFGSSIMECSTSRHKDHKSENDNYVDEQKTALVSPKDNKGSHLTKLNTDVSSDLSKSPPFSPFSPFSPFGQEIQAINASAAVNQSANVAQSNISGPQSAPGSKGIRRITPIPVKDVNEKSETMSSSFQTVVMNSPVLPEIYAQGDRSNSNPAQSDSSKTSVTSDKMGLGNIMTTLCHESGSDSKTLGADSVVSGKSGSVLLSSQSSGSHDLNTQGQSLTISQPVVFCEDANVGFPKIQAKPQPVHVGILSEESLFQCLSKVPHASDTLQTVSNLTNILHALDGKSQIYDPANSTPELPANCVQSQGVLQPQANMNNENSHKINDDLSTHSETSTSVSTVVEGGVIASDKSSQDEAISSRHRHATEGFTYSTEAESQISKSEQFKDNENESCRNKQSELSDTAQTEHLATLGKIHSDSNIHDSDNSYVGMNSEIQSFNNGSNDQEQLKGVSDESNEISRNKQQSKETEKRSKMSRRELRKSLYDKEGPEVINVHVEGDTDHIVDKNSAFTESPNLTKEIVGDDEVTEIVKIGVDTEGSDDKNAEVEGANGGDLKVATLNETTPIKSEPDSQNDSQSETSSKGKKRSKHKNKRKSEKKKKKRRDDTDSDGSSHREKKKSKKRRRDSELESRSVKDVEQTPVTGAEPMDTDAATGEDADLPEPTWSKETDKTILETCQAHGIKEKTFIRIARTIGNVTAKQVQKRLAVLYEMILGHPYGEKKE